MLNLENGTITLEKSGVVLSRDLLVRRHLGAIFSPEHKDKELSEGAYRYVQRL